MFSCDGMSDLGHKTLMPCWFVRTSNDSLNSSNPALCIYQYLNITCTYLTFHHLVLVVEQEGEVT